MISILARLSEMISHCSTQHFSETTFHVGIYGSLLTLSCKLNTISMKMEFFLVFLDNGIAYELLIVVVTTV